MVMKLIICCMTKGDAKFEKSEMMRYNPDNIHAFPNVFHSALNRLGVIGFPFLSNFGAGANVTVSPLEMMEAERMGLLSNCNSATQ